MIGLCVVRRNNMWVVTSSDTVTHEEAIETAHYEVMPKIEAGYFKESFLLKYFLKAKKEQ